MSISFQDVERLQALYPENQIELREGRLIIMSPSDGVSGAVGARFGRLLANWVYDHNLGEVLDSSTGFRLPNGDLLSPDVAFVSRERLKRIVRAYLAVVPELIVEIKSSSDRVRGLEEKIALFLRQGVQVGILIDPDKKAVSVYYSTGITTDDDGEEAILQKTTLQDGDMLAIPELFPGWETAITNFWPSVYE
ncbi:MAG: Uma2 family endonuclease [Ktedonobacteraceae bacterium]